MIPPPRHVQFPQYRNLPQRRQREAIGALVMRQASLQCHDVPRTTIDGAIYHTVRPLPYPIDLAISGGYVVARAVRGGIAAGIVRSKTAGGGGDGGGGTGGGRGGGGGMIPGVGRRGRCPGRPRPPRDSSGDSSVNGSGRGNSIGGCGDSIVGRTSGGGRGGTRFRGRTMGRMRMRRRRGR